MIQTLDLFPQSIGCLHYEGDLSLYIKKIYEIQSQVNNFVVNFPKELQYQTPPDLFDKYSEFNFIKNFIEELISNYYNKTLKICNSWANIYSKFGYTPYHTHLPYPVSGVLYLTTPPNDFLKIHNKNSSSEAKNILVKSGDILFFSGDQPHSTYPNLSNYDKIIIAFNLVKA